MNGDKSGSPPCGIYVRIDDFSDMPAVITKLRQMAMVINRASGYAKNMSVVELVYDAAAKGKITDLVAIIQAEGLVAIMRGEDLCGADGVLLEDITQIKTMRGALGEDAIIGAVCSTRSQAEQAIASGADYVTLMADPALITCFRAKGDVLCAATGRNLTHDHCGVLVRAGASFIDVTDYIWTYEKGVMQSTVNVLNAINTANTLH